MLGLRQDSITHMSKDGKILFEFVFTKPMDNLGMMNEREVIMLETRGKWFDFLDLNEGESPVPCITILDLETHKFRRTPFHFFNDETDQS